MDTKRSILDISTGHVSFPSRAWLEEQSAISLAYRAETDERPVATIAGFGYGWFMTAHPPEGAREVIPADINRILDIPVQLSVELGRTRIPIKHILQLAQGSVVELDALAGEPMDVLVNGYLIAQGEVVVVNDKFGIRLTDIVTPSERMRRLSRG